jgi:hypothetical protein
MTIFVGNISDLVNGIVEDRGTITVPYDLLKNWFCDNVPVEGNVFDTPPDLVIRNPMGHVSQWPNAPYPQATMGGIITSIGFVWAKANVFVSIEINNAALQPNQAHYHMPPYGDLNQALTRIIGSSNGAGWA